MQPSPAGDAPSAWKTRWRYVVGLGLIAVLAYFAFVRGEQVPLLAAVDLGFHELGHMLLGWAPEVPAVLAGSVTQVAVPLGLAAYFLGARHDLFAGALMLGWAGTSAQNASVYIADAPYETLELLGNGMHDWAFLLAVWNATDSAASIARGVWVLGLLLLLCGAGLCVGALAGPAVSSKRAESERARLASLPVHEPATPVARHATGGIAADAVRPLDDALSAKPD